MRKNQSSPVVYRPAMTSNNNVATLIEMAGSILDELRIMHEKTSVHEDEVVLGNDIISVIWVSCAGLARLAKEINVSRVDKISTTTENDIAVRLAILGRDQYGATIRTPDGQTKTEPGYTRWIAQAIHVTRPSKDPAIRIRTRSLAFNRPPSLTRRAFDTALRRELAAWDLERRCPAAKRYTNYVDLKRISRAEELVTGLDPRTDGDRLLAVVEGILSRHRQR